MSFDDDYNDIEPINSGLKKVSSQKSIFDSSPKKKAQSEFKDLVKNIHEKSSLNKLKAKELTDKFNKTFNDKTLKENKNVFSLELEKELLSEMIQFSIDINNDQSEMEGMGSLTWVTLLLKTCLLQRDRINKMDYDLSLLNKKIDKLNEDLSKKI